MRTHVTWVFAETLAAAVAGQAFALNKRSYRTSPRASASSSPQHHTTRSLIAESIGHRALTSIDGTRDVDDMPPLRIEKMFGLRLVV